MPAADFQAVSTKRSQSDGEEKSQETEVWQC